MKRTFIWFFILAIAAINWAALHDILKGEADVWLEWAFVGVSMMWLAAYLFRKLHV